MRAKLFYKVSNIENLKSLNSVESGVCYEDVEVAISKVIELDEGNFNEFCNGFLRDFGFIAADTYTMLIDIKKVWRCIAVACKASKDVLIIHSEGYNYARYIGIITRKELAAARAGKKIPTVKKHLLD